MNSIQYASDSFSYVSRMGTQHSLSREKNDAQGGCQNGGV